MTYLLSTLLAVAIIVGLPAALTVVARRVIDNHHRGMARVHRGVSWTPKVPEQRDAA